MLGESIADLRAIGLLPERDGGDLPEDAPIAVKEAVMPFNRFKTPDGRNVDTVLGPEMKSTGEVMGFDADFGTAFAKAQTASYGSLPTSGRVFVSVANRDKRNMIFPIKVLADRGFEILATAGTAGVLRRNGVQVTTVRKHHEGEGPHGEKTTVQLIRDGDIDLVINTPYSTGGSARARRLRDPHGRRGRQHPVHHHGPGPRRRGAGDRGAGGRRHRRTQPAGLELRGVTALMGRPYRLLFDHVLTRTDPERAHHAAFAAIRAAAPGDHGGCRRRPAATRSTAMGLRFPHAARARRRLRQERRRHRRPRRRSASGTSRSAP